MNINSMVNTAVNKLFSFDHKGNATPRVEDFRKHTDHLIAYITLFGVEGIEEFLETMYQKSKFHSGIYSDEEICYVYKTRWFVDEYSNGTCILRISIPLASCAILSIGLRDVHGKWSSCDVYREF